LTLTFYNKLNRQATICNFYLEATGC